MMLVRFHVESRVDVTEIMEFYEDAAGSALAIDFQAEVRQFVDKIAERPESFPSIRKNVRRANLQRFPYHIVFEIVDTKTVKILVVKHNRRRPSFGMSRR